MDPQEIKKRNKRLLISLLGLVLVIEIFPWVYAPLYQHVCGVLGINTTSYKPADQLLAEARGTSDKAQLVRFMGVSGELPITIEPLERQAMVEIGDVFSVMYRLKNESQQDLDYRAIHSTIPAADPSFELIKCFCEDHRVIKAGATEEWPVVFRLVSAPTDPNGLTLNYTLFNYNLDKTQPATK